VQELCTEEEGLLDYLHFHYCTMRGAEAASVTLLVLVVLATFYLLGETAEEFFCPVVRRLTQDLRLAPSTAGVTLLALVCLPPPCSHRRTPSFRSGADTSQTQPDHSQAGEEVCINRPYHTGQPPRASLHHTPA
jgi:hypothetical protein